jgi:hypothetical protein
MVLMGIGWEGVDQMHWTWGRDQRQAQVNTFRFHKMWEIFWLKWLLASQQGLHSMELVSWFSHAVVTYKLWSKWWLYSWLCLFLG